MLQEKKQTFCSTQYTKYQILTEVFSSVQLLNRVQLFATPRTAACQVSLSITSFRSLFKLMSIKSKMPFNHLILYHPLLLLPSIFPRIRVLHTKGKKKSQNPHPKGTQSSSEIQYHKNNVVSFAEIYILSVLVF